MSASHSEKTMRRVVVLAPCLAVAAVAIGIGWNLRASQAPELVAAVQRAIDNALPIKQVVLFNSGVGYFERGGEVTGDSHVDLAFPAADINDLLKSLVLQDLGGGRISTVSYDSQDPVDKILHSFAIDLNSNPTFGQILNQARGEKIEIQLLSKDKAIPAKLTGTIVGMETRTVHDDKHNPVTTDVLNLMSPEGLQSIPLEQFLGVRFLNPVLDSDFQRALRVLAGSHDLQKKTVSLGFTGQGKRAVKVGYVVERPIWKTTYRLRLEPAGKAALQGWALVENTSDDDWHDVRMVLVSGRPISFKMNLYDPLYIPRPTVEPDQFASLRPPVYAGSMEGAGVPVAQNATNLPGMLLQPRAGAVPFNGPPMGGFGGGAPGGGLGNGGIANNEQFQLQERLRQFQNGGDRAQQQLGLGNNYQNNFRNNGNFDGNGFNNFNPSANNRLTYEELQQRRQQLAAVKDEAKAKGAAIAMNFREGIQSVATAEEVGDYYQYVIDQRISLSRQKSAMLPIVDQTIDGSKLSIFNESIHSKYPLLGLRLKNTSGQPLTQGPITVYDSGTYAGDTRILDLQPNEVRLLSYALDQAVEVKTTTKSSPSPDMTFKIDEARLNAHYKNRETRTYAIKNRATVERTVIVEHPIRSGWTLVDGTKPNEKSRDVYRFEIKVPAGAIGKLVVAEDQPRTDNFVRQNQPSFVTSTGIEVKAVVHVDDEKLLKLRATKGVLTPTVKLREMKSFFVQNISDIDRDFTIDHVVRKEWKLFPGGKDEPIAGPHVYRFTLHADKSKTGERDLSEEKIADTAPKVVKDLSDAKIREYMVEPMVSDAVKAGLAKTLELRQKTADAEKQFADLTKQLKALSDDNARLRENLHVIPQTAEPYKDFLKKFVTQESEIETLQRQVRTAETSLTNAQRAYQVFITTWTAE
jgi:hypothetical protein